MKYSVEGSIRGVISRHRKLSAAVKSMRKDHGDCYALGGGAYSDVDIVRLDGEPLSDEELEEILKEADKEFK